MGSTRKVHNHPKEKNQDAMECNDIRKEIRKNPSLKTLITWNISKALEYNPRIDLRMALIETQERLESHDVDILMSPDGRNLSCAFLAWQRLGHHAADSLFSFVEQILKKDAYKENAESPYNKISYESYKPRCPVTTSEDTLQNISRQEDFSCNPFFQEAFQWGPTNSNATNTDFRGSIGLVVKLPEPQTVLRFTAPGRGQAKPDQPSAHRKPSARDTTKKIASACCMDEGCIKKLSSLEVEAQELRQRAAQVARRESKRAELLDSAEMAWRDLDSAYHRRLRQAKEKEKDIENQMANLLDERNSYKAACMPLVAALKTKSETAEKEQDALKQLEQAVCGKACTRHALLKNDERASAQLTEHQCKASQLDRDLALQEEQELRKQRMMTGAVEAAQLVVHETEHAQRAEFNALSAQVKQATQELLEEDARNTLLKQRIADYVEDKNQMITDLEDCQAKCDGGMEKLVRNLKEMKVLTAEFEKKAKDCVCKEPANKEVEVKRTPSLAALCKCSPNELLEDTCSCKSQTSLLLSSLFRDLFGGLKSEMDNIGSEMPCHLLKCLEDRHNWERSSEAKKNVRAYFSRLLLAELDIAIVTTIEKCREQWVPSPTQDSMSSCCPQHELEVKAHMMAINLANKMFQEKTQKLTEQAEDISTDDRPICSCRDPNDEVDKSGRNLSAVYRCMVHPQPLRNMGKTKKVPTITSVIHHRRDKTTQRMQIYSEKNDSKGATIYTSQPMDKNRKKKPETSIKNYNSACKTTIEERRNTSFKARKPNKSIISKDEPVKEGIHVSNKVFKGQHQYAVHMCLCDKRNNLASDIGHQNQKIESKSCCNHKLISNVSNLRQSKPVLSFDQEINTYKVSDATNLNSCTEKYECFHKLPSNTSIDRLIGILTKWKDNLTDLQEECIKKALSTDSLFKITHASIVSNFGQTDTENRLIDSGKSKACLIDVKPSHESKKTIEVKDDKYTEVKVSNQLPANQSEYMGAVNLDRSNDLFAQVEQNHIPAEYISLAKCTGEGPISAETKVQLVQSQNRIPIKNEIGRDFVDIDKPLNKSNYDGIGNIKKVSMKNKLLSSALLSKKYENCIQCLGVTLTDTSPKPSFRKDYKQDNQNNDQLHNHQQRRNNHRIDSQNEIIKQGRNKEQNKEIGDVTKFSLRCPEKCETSINFLGVVLNKVTTKRLQKEYQKKQQNQNYDRSHSPSKFFKQERMKNNDKLVNKEIKSNTNRDSSNLSCAVKQNNTAKVFNTDNESACSPNSEVDNSSVLNSMETGDSKICDNILNSEACICDPAVDADSSHDLEVNTFELLAEHLKSKLEEFKHSVCKSSCMENADEKNLVNNTLLKVKKLILESAETVTSNCLENNKYSNGSWNRAHSLLQEYLKTKIERVRCLCDASDNNSSKSLVPCVLNRISCLIENDLERLKDLCKCKNTSVTEPLFEMHNMHNSNSIVVTNNSKNLTVPNENYVTTSERVGPLFVNYTNPTSLPHNKSAQVLLHNLAMVTRSCDAFKAYTKYSEVQTVDTFNEDVIIDKNKKPSKKDKNESKTENNSEPDEQSKKSSVVTSTYEEQKKAAPPANLLSNKKIKGSELLVDKQLIDERKQDDMDNIDKTGDWPGLQYIGCTMNCSCDRDLGCVCTKSTVLKNTDWLKNYSIRNAFTKKQSVNENVSYLLNNLPKPPKDDVDDTAGIGKTKMTRVNYPNQCESSTCTDDEQNVYPSRSIEKISFVYTPRKIKKNQASHANFREPKVNATEENYDCMKISKQRLNMAHGTTNDNLFPFFSTAQRLQHHGILKRNICQLSKNDSKHLGQSKATMTIDDTSQKAELSTNCDCAMVPVCHVKMLVDNIGIKLVKAECTCDSLKAVCPVHSQ